jgi:DNA-binding GntR family transcriptional regulator
MPAKKKNLRLKAYNTIKQEIVTLKLPPGSYLDKEKIQERLKVGLTPVREALLRLEAENLVTALTNKGFYVKDLNIQSIKDLLENRIFLERYVGFLAIQRITKKDIEELEEVALKMEALAANSDEYGLVMKDREFHMLMVKSTRNSQLERIMNLIYNESLRIWFISHYEDLAESVKMHFETVEVLRKKDWKLLHKDIVHHNMVFQERVRSYFRKILAPSQGEEDEFKVDFSIDNAWS